MSGFHVSGVYAWKIAVSICTVRNDKHLLIMVITVKNILKTYDRIYRVHFKRVWLSRLCFLYKFRKKRVWNLSSFVDVVQRLFSPELHVRNMLRKPIPGEETAAEDFKDDIYVSHLRPRCSPIGLTREVLIFNDTDKHLLLWPSSHYSGSFYKATVETKISAAKVFFFFFQFKWRRTECYFQEALVCMPGWLCCWDIQSHLWRIN